MPKKGDAWRSPRGSTINEFKRHIMEPMLDELFAELAVAMMDRIKVVHRGEGYIVVTIDSTPAEASRYNFDADFNTHYMVRMDKMNIIMMDGMPLFMIPTDGNTSDTKPMDDLFSLLDRYSAQSGMDRDVMKVMADSGYDSFLSFDTVHRHTGAVMNCPVREGSVYHDEASWKNLQRAYSGSYRMKGFDPERKNDREFVLNFLRKCGKSELVGMYLRNLEMERMQKQLEEGVKDTDREVCEVMHHSMKSWVDFTTKKIRHATRHVTLKCKFFVVQLLSVIFKGYVQID
ncbi:MAG: hypothetical protein IJV47_01200 [Candidatus Methanomethylophilaceae archaeon]|nr:hypothetical protein [Candidatus Methanomethylophilaceae archaeon]